MEMMKHVPYIILGQPRNGMRFRIVGHAKTGSIGLVNVFQYSAYLLI
jgi:hypothetical protein